MKKTIITTICLLLLVAGYAQENNKRYEFCSFQVKRGFSTGAVTTDIIFEKGLLSTSEVEICRQNFFEKDIIFDVKLVNEENRDILRVYHLEEVLQDDIKIIFMESVQLSEFEIAPSRYYKF